VRTGHGHPAVSEHSGLTVLVGTAVGRQWVVAVKLGGGSLGCVQASSYPVEDNLHSGNQLAIARHSVDVTQQVLLCQGLRSLHASHLTATSFPVPSSPWPAAMCSAPSCTATSTPRCPS
jgi:hypothetical protein